MSIRFVGPIVIETHDEVLFAPSGSVGRWAKGLAREQTINIRAQAPHTDGSGGPSMRRRPPRGGKFPGRGGSGNMARQVSSQVDREGAKVIGISTRSGADYSLFVIKGTRDQYRRNSRGQFGLNATGFPLPGVGWAAATRRQRVRGQAANNFMLRGFGKTAAHHPSIRQRGVSTIYGL